MVGIRTIHVEFQVSRLLRLLEIIRLNAYVWCSSSGRPRIAGLRDIGSGGAGGGLGAPGAHAGHGHDDDDDEDGPDENDEGESWFAGGERRYVSLGL